MNAAAILSSDLVLAVLQATDKPLTVAEIRRRVRSNTNIVLDRSTIYGVLKRALARSEAASDVGADGTGRWFAIPSAEVASADQLAHRVESAAPVPMRS